MCYSANKKNDSQVFKILADQFRANQSNCQVLSFLHSTKNLQKDITKYKDRHFRKMQKRNEKNKRANKREKKQHSYQLLEQFFNSNSKTESPCCENLKCKEWSHMCASNEQIFLCFGSIDVHFSKFLTIKSEDMYFLEFSKPQTHYSSYYCWRKTDH